MPHMTDVSSVMSHVWCISYSLCILCHTCVDFLPSSLYQCRHKQGMSVCVTKVSDTSRASLLCFSSLVKREPIRLLKSKQKLHTFVLDTDSLTDTQFLNNSSSVPENLLCSSRLIRLMIHSFIYLCIYFGHDSV